VGLPQARSGERLSMRAKSPSAAFCDAAARFPYLLIQIRMRKHEDRDPARIISKR
jgi:hypothetical protein